MNVISRENDCGFALILALPTGNVLHTKTLNPMRSNHVPKVAQAVGQGQLTLIPGPVSSAFCFSPSGIHPLSKEWLLFSLDPFQWGWFRGPPAR